MDILMKLEVKDKMDNFIRKNIVLFNSFKNVYLFGSILNINKVCCKYNKNKIIM